MIYKLTSVTFNDGLEYIGAKVFFSTKTESVSIPSTDMSYTRKTLPKQSKL